VSCKCPSAEYKQAFFRERHNTPTGITFGTTLAQGDKNSSARQ